MIFFRAVFKEFKQNLCQCEKHWHALIYKELKNKSCLKEDRATLKWCGCWEDDIIFCREINRVAYFVFFVMKI
jgi:hypothetical protein